ncbi:DNA polymerase III subunit delta [Leuconostoc palmae]|uniref:DNA polymerase III subunit delta n=1 Tax=Leuconostoc palmae TaxID=501487 RepID=UPI001C7D25F4|nr:DNA polymerase III subunit delta [Leuconostoc palmae]
MNLNQLQQQIKNNALANFYTITGNEEILVQRAHRSFKEMILPEDRDMNYSEFDLTQQEFDLAMSDAMSMPFFGERRVVMIKNPDFLTSKGKLSEQNQNQLLSLLDKPVAENIVVFLINDLKIDKRKKITKTILKNAENIELPALGEQAARQAVMEYLSQYGYSMNNDAMQEFLLRTNAHYTTMLHELPKLMAYATKDKKIDIIAIDELVPKTLIANVFDLVDAVMSNQVKQALMIYRELLQNGEQPLRVNAVLTGQFRLLLQVAALRGTDQEVSQQLGGVHPYRIKLARQAIKKYPLKMLRDGFLGMVNIEIKLKSTSQDPELLFERFILNIK